jgi:hypothetical protein
MASTVNNISIALLVIGMFLIGANYITPAITGMISGTTTVLVATITMPTSTVAFGSMAIGETNTTGDESPPPFVVQNDGNVDLNITIGAANLWTATAGANPSAYFLSMCNATAEIGTCPAGSNTTMNGIPATGSPGRIIAYLPWADAADTLQVEINVTVPAAEAGGSKSSEVTLTASHAYV